MKSLGKTLKEARELIPMTLRQVEEATGISNAYNSQLENDKIKKPSANVLYKLSRIYNIEIEEMLFAAGIIKEEQKIKEMEGHLKMLKNLTPKEHQQLKDYLAFLRHKKVIPRTPHINPTPALKQTNRQTGYTQNEIPKQSYNKEEVVHEPSLRVPPVPGIDGRPWVSQNAEPCHPGKTFAF